MGSLFEKGGAGAVILAGLSRSFNTIEIEATQFSKSKTHIVDVDSSH
jgi:hypothetical protein